MPRPLPQMPPGLQEILMRNLAPGMQDQELPPEALQDAILRNIAMEKSGSAIPMPEAQGPPGGGQAIPMPEAQGVPGMGQAIPMPTAGPEQIDPRLGQPQQTPVDTTDREAAMLQMIEQAKGHDPFPGAGDQFNKPIGILEQLMGQLKDQGITAASAGTINPALVDLVRGKGQ